VVVLQRRNLTVGVLVGVLGLVMAGSAQAQIQFLQTDCWSRQPPSVGVVTGRTQPYLELHAKDINASPGGSLSVGGGPNVAARLDLSPAGPLLVRFEGGMEWWDVRQKTYDPEANFSLIADRSVGTVWARRLVALAGLRFRDRHPSRLQICPHVLVGVGLYSINLPGGITRRQPGGAIVAGVDLPTGERGAVQLDLQLHATDAYAVPALTVGWAYRFPPR
jgi:hypothetical protein